MYSGYRGARFSKPYAISNVIEVEKSLLLLCYIIVVRARTPNAGDVLYLELTTIQNNENCGTESG